MCISGVNEARLPEKEALQVGSSCQYLFGEVETRIAAEIAILEASDEFRHLDTKLAHKASGG